MTKNIVMRDIEDVKTLVEIASKTGFPVQISTGSNFRNAASMLGIFSVDFTQPFDIHYDGTNEELDAFVAAHEVG